MASKRSIDNNIDGEKKIKLDTLTVADFLEAVADDLKGLTGGVEAKENVGLIGGIEALPLVPRIEAVIIGLTEIVEALKHAENPLSDVSQAVIAKVEEVIDGLVGVLKQKSLTGGVEATVSTGKLVNAVVEALASKITVFADAFVESLKRKEEEESVSMTTLTHPCKDLHFLLKPTLQTTFTLCSKCNMASRKIPVMDVDGRRAITVLMCDQCQMANCTIHTVHQKEFLPLAWH